ncbi:MAG: oligosaccharide flippase family protein, partial [Alphaproteobacteria bacterium]
MRDKLGHVLKDAAQLYGAQVLGLVVGFGISMVVARVLGADGRGAYGWIMGLFMVAIPLGQLGTDVVNRRVAATRPELAPVLAGNTVMQTLGWGSVVALGVYMVARGTPIGAAYPWALALAMVMLPLNMTHGLLGSVAAGLGKFKVVAGMEIVQRLSMAALVGVMLLTVQLDVVHLLVAQGIALLGGLAFVGWHMVRLAGWPWRGNVG